MEWNNKDSWNKRDIIKKLLFRATQIHYNNTCMLTKHVSSWHTHLVD